LESTAKLAVSHPHLWQGVDDPYLYRLVVELSNKSSQPLDRVSFPFGIRLVRFDPDNGLFLNGKHVTYTALAITRIVRARAGLRNRKTLPRTRR
jgi:beta-galactosidase/beta-glucuronidase